MNEFYDYSIYDIPKSTLGDIINKQETSNSRITILLNNSENNNELLDFLSKIIQAIGLDMKTDCILREIDLTKKEKINIANIQSTDKTKTVIGFGFLKNNILTQALIQDYNWNVFDNFSLLLTHELSEIKTNVDYKRNLWINLKKKF